MAAIRKFLDERVPQSLLWILSIATFVISKLIQVQWLDKSYLDSKFPVPFYEGRLRSMRSIMVT